ncbi:hypothetical protein PG985_009604 [Apiospora marii]|uniref:2EXR domain-containing protein n=1 Tax=Apiospora marii TaxID=335849 RepID=A0ABR1RFS8_9PEZI
MTTWSEGNATRTSTPDEAADSESEGLEALWDEEALRDQHQDTISSQDTISPSSFHPFARLPPEVRNQIWDLALPRRVVSINECLWSKDYHVVDGKYIITRPRDRYATYVLGFDRRRYGPPGVAHACREARAVAGEGRVVSVDQYRSIPEEYLSRHELAEDWVEYTWFDPERDTLLVELDYPNNTSYPRTAFETHAIQDIEELASCVRHVIITDCRRNDPHCFIEGLFNPRFFPCLRTVGVVSRKVFAEGSMKDRCWFLQEAGRAWSRDDHDLLLLELAEDNTADACQVAALQRQLRALSTDDGAVDVLCERLALLQEPAVGPRRAGEPMGRDRAANLREEFAIQCAMWTPLVGLRGFGLFRLSQDEGSEVDSWPVVLWHDDYQEKGLAWVAVPPPGRAEYAASLCPRIYKVAWVE